MKNRRENIKNKLAYFYKVIKNMDIKDNIKQSKINEHEMPLDEISYDQISINENMDKHLEEQSLLGWIELIENQKLYRAIKELPVEDQIFISYFIKESKTQSKLSRFYNLNQAQICRKTNKILRILRHNILNK